MVVSAKSASLALPILRQRPTLSSVRSIRNKDRVRSWVSGSTPCTCPLPHQEQSGNKKYVSFNLHHSTINYYPSLWVCRAVPGNDDFAIAASRSATRCACMPSAANSRAANIIHFRLPISPYSFAASCFMGKDSNYFRNSKTFPTKIIRAKGCSTREEGAYWLSMT